MADFAATSVDLPAGPFVRILERLAFVLPTKVPWWEEVLLAVAGTVAAVAIRAALQPLVGQDITYIAFVPSVLLSAVVGGRLAGALAATLGCLAANWFFVGRAFAFDFDLQHLWSLIVSWIACALVILIGDRMAVALRREAALNRRLELVSRELEHRIKNLITVAQSVVNQTAKPGMDPEVIREKISARLQAVGAAQSLIIRTPGCALRLSELVELVLRPFGRLPLLTAEESAVRVSPNIATGLALILNELATNASKYGALSQEGGRVDLSWREDADQLLLAWIENGGPPVVETASQGFGSALFRRALDETEGRVETAFRPEGLECRIRIWRNGPPSSVDRSSVS